MKAKSIWKLFKYKTLLDYTKLYLKSDVLILSDVVENFRNVCLNSYKLDPLHFFSALRLTWEALLKHFKAEISSFSDKDMHTFIEKGIKGGVSHSMKRYAKENNEIYMKYIKYIYMKNI